MEENFKIDNDGIPTDVLISLRKLFGIVNHQIQYYKVEMEEHENNAQLYILGKPDKTYMELLSKQEEWIWLKQFLTDKWTTLLIK